ncbi:hypothetical protein Syun_015377 [Stephania yunnanensis]|uniref:Uncharacterized protein n=1 Tax=Stephania yunnanensis TaxID=152371 RepID=A0AAP0JL88_9MAGN
MDLSSLTQTNIRLYIESVQIRNRTVGLRCVKQTNSSCYMSFQVSQQFLQIVLFGEMVGWWK